MAYSDGDVRQAIEARGRRAGGQGPAGDQRRTVPENRLSLSTSQTGTVTCPAGNTTTGDARQDHGPQGPPGGRLPLCDSRHLRGACPLRDQACTTGQSEAARSLSDVHHARIEAARDRPSATPRSKRCCGAGRKWNGK